jgi:hypothetical protein
MRSFPIHVITLLGALIASSTAFAQETARVCGTERMRHFDRAAAIRNTAERSPELYRASLAEMKGAHTQLLSADEVTFWAPDFVSQSFTQIKAVRVHMGRLARVWVDVRDTGRADLKAKLPLLITALEDSTAPGSRDRGKGIIENDVDVFGPTPTAVGDGYQDFLLFDISDQSVLGFFLPNDQSTEQFSNRRNLLYIDSREGLQRTTSVLNTLAHEFQHLIHFGIDQNSDLFLNEGCSETAGLMCGYPDRTNPDYLRNTNTRLFDFPSDPIGNNQAYERALTFVHYLYEQFGDRFLHELLLTHMSYMAAVDSALTAIASGASWETVGPAFAVANWLQTNADPRYAYKVPVTSAIQRQARPLRTYSASNARIHDTVSVPPYGIAYLVYDAPPQLSIRMKGRYRYRVVAVGHRGSDVDVMDFAPGEPIEIGNGVVYDRVVLILVELSNATQRMTWDLNDGIGGAERETVASAPGFVSVSPNPSHERGAITFVSAGDEPVRLALYSVRGGLVSTLVDGERIAPGAHRVAFDALPPGTYFARLSQGGSSASLRPIPPGVTRPASMGQSLGGHGRELSFHGALLYLGQPRSLQPLLPAIEMGRFYVLTLALLAFLLPSHRAAAQQQLILIFPDTPCDSVSCSQINVDGGRIDPSVRSAFIFRDGTSFAIDASLLGADTIAAGEPIRVPICFRPTRRGQITDSLAVVVVSGAVRDTFRVRVTGRGIGPELEPDPIALNFPLTNPGSSATIPVTLKNVGELPFTFDAAALTVPAPFQLATPGPIVIPPGASISVDITFAPSSNGVYSDVGELRAGCARRLQIGLNGATDLIGTGAVLRTSKVRFNPVNDEETPCSVTQCTPMTISNAGNATLVVDDIRWAVDTAGYRITNLPPMPILVSPNSQKTFDVCLEGRGRGRLVDTLVVRSNSRTSIAFGMVLDLSKSMDSLMSCDSGFSPARISQAIVQAQRFIARTLLYLPAVGVQDYLAIMRYSSVIETRTIFNLQPITDASRSAAQATLNGLMPNGDTQTGTALMRMMDTLMKAPLANRVIVLISDGAARDTIRYPADTLAARAIRLGIRIFTVQIGTQTDNAARAYLQRLANANGRYFNGNDCGTLQQSFEMITDLVSRGQINREPFAMKVTAPKVITSGSLRFDSTYFLTTSCATVTLTNVGEGEAVIDSIQLRDAFGATTAEFSFGPSVTFPIRIPESGQVGVDVCFRPAGLRERGGSTSFTYNSCSPDILGSTLSGTGWARAGLRIDDERIGLPGSIAMMPVYLDSTVAAYDVHSIRFRVRWNKSMLDLRTVRPLAAAGAASIALDGPVRFDGRDAVADFVANGDFYEPAGQLAELEYMVLRGDTLGSTIELSSARFEDDNPKPLMKNAGLIAFDSTCFRSSKTIALGAPPAGKVTRLDVAPVPARRGSAVTLSIDVDGPTSVRATLYDALGARVAATVELQLDASGAVSEIPTDGLAAGAYYVVVGERSGTTHIRSIVVAE